MDKKKLIKKAQDPNYISGIYNYCDRWCQRCIFNANCLNYDISEEEFGDLESKEAHNEEFFKRLQKIFQQTQEMLIENAEEMGIDLNFLDMEPETENVLNNRGVIHEHELSQSALEYSKMITAWIEKEYALFEEKQESIHTLQKIGVDEDRLRDEAYSIHDPLEVIHWYKYQIFVKIMRAFSVDDEILKVEGLQKGSDGSAKVALIGMDRSVGAWGRLQEIFPDLAAGIMEILVHLNRLRRRTEKTFPNARSFLRPGSDTHKG